MQKKIFKAKVNVLYLAKETFFPFSYLEEPERWQYKKEGWVEVVRKTTLKLMACSFPTFCWERAFNVD